MAFRSTVRVSPRSAAQPRLRLMRFRSRLQRRYGIYGITMQTSAHVRYSVIERLTLRISTHGTTAAVSTAQTMPSSFLNFASRRQASASSCASNGIVTPTTMFFVNFASPPSTLYIRYGSHMRLPQRMIRQIILSPPCPYRRKAYRTAPESPRGQIPQDAAPKGSVSARTAFPPKRFPAPRAARQPRRCAGRS